MQVSIESVTKIERRVTIVVPAEKYDEAYENHLDQLAKTAKVDGFRKGKVPMTYIKSHFGDFARQKALSEVIESTLYDAIDKEQLRPISVPKVEPKMVMPGQPLEFTATFEVLPEIDKVRFDINAIEKHTAEIVEEDIDNVIQRLREQHTRWTKVDRAAREKDKVIIDYTLSVDGEPVKDGKATQYPIVLGSKTMVPGFEEGLVGVKANEEKKLAVTFPENYFAKDVAGKLSEFTVKVHSVFQPELPELDEAFVKQLGVKNGKVEDLHAEVRRNLERQLKYLVNNKLKTQVFDTVMEQNIIDVPNTLIEREAKRIHDELHPHHEHGEDHGHSEEEMAKFNDIAKKNVTLRLLFDAIVKQHQLSVDKERVKNYISSLASAYENPTKVMDWYTTDKRRLAEAEMHVLEEQVVEKMIEQIKVTEKKMSYSDLVKNVTSAEKN